MGTCDTYMGTCGYLWVHMGTYMYVYMWAAHVAMYSLGGDPTTTIKQNSCSDGERGTCWSRQSGRDPGGGVCEAGSQDSVPPGVPAEDCTPCEPPPRSHTL